MVSGVAMIVAFTAFGRCELFLTLSQVTSAASGSSETCYNCQINRNVPRTEKSPRVHYISILDNKCYLKAVPMSHQLSHDTVCSVLLAYEGRRLWSVEASEVSRENTMSCDTICLSQALSLSLSATAHHQSIIAIPPVTHPVTDRTLDTDKQLLHLLNGPVDEQDTYR